MMLETGPHLCGRQNPFSLMLSTVSAAVVVQLEDKKLFSLTLTPRYQSVFRSGTCSVQQMPTGNCCIASTVCCYCDYCFSSTSFSLSPEQKMYYLFAILSISLGFQIDTPLAPTRKTKSPRR